LFEFRELIKKLDKKKKVFIRKQTNSFYTKKTSKFNYLY